MQLLNDLESLKITRLRQKTKVSGEDISNFLVKSLETADPELRESIENDLVKICSHHTEELNKLLHFLSSDIKYVRSHSAMAIIRTGFKAIPFIECYFTQKDASHTWLKNYLIEEISGTNISLQDTDIEEEKVAC